jgi:hypothetical protein
VATDDLVSGQAYGAFVSDSERDGEAEAPADVVEAVADFIDDLVDDLADAPNPPPPNGGPA